MVERTPADRDPSQAVVPLPFPGRDRPAAHLPTTLTSFVGREDDIAAVVALLQRPGVRFVSLTGPGGVGKTRLAIRVAEALAPDFLDARWFVPLAAIRDAGLVTAAMAERFGVRDGGGETVEEQIKRFLGDRRALVVLDNVEHVLAAGPHIVDLLGSCPGLTVLATSRAVLRLSGEHVYDVPPLAVPARTPSTLDELASLDAIRLFVERATASASTFALTPANAAAVAAICRRLDGLPLAIELAAARLRALPPEAILARLERRLDLLTGGPRDVPTRLQTMRAAIAWSFDQLDLAEQALFRRLAVFVGGFTLDAAEFVGGEAGRRAGGKDEPVSFPPARLPASLPSVLDGVTSLAEKSVLRPVPEAGEPRYEMLETIREFGLERLAASGEEPMVRGAHAAWFVAMAERAEPEVGGPNTDIWSAWVKAEMANIRAALGWLHERGDAEAALRLALGIGWLLEAPGYYREALDIFEGLIAMQGAERAPMLLIRALTTAADLADWLYDLERSQALYERALAVSQATGNTGALPSIYRGLGSVALSADGPERAMPHLREGRRLALAAGDDWEAAAAANLLGRSALALGDYVQAIGHHEDALAGWRRADALSFVPHALIALGQAALAAGRLSRARAAFRETLDLPAAGEDIMFTSGAVKGMGGVAAGLGDWPAAALLFAAADAHADTVEVAIERPAVRAIYAAIKARVEAMLGADAIEWRDGAALTLEQAIDAARAVAEADPALEPETGADRTAVGATSGLTRREADVLRLLADRLTDREIAERLYLSPRTVGKHVQSILAKLDLPNRRAAATEAKRLGLD